MITQKLDVMDIPYNVFVKPYNKQSKPEYYNMFFNPIICHVCKKRPKTCDSFKICECNMISYCDDEHQEMHREEHRDLCDAILKVNAYKVLWNTCCMSMAEWTATKKRLLELVQAELKRELKSYEVQMFLFVKSCFICHGRPQEGNFCQKCHCIVYCNAHKNALNVHTIFCSQLELSLSLDLDKIGSGFPIINFIDNFPNLNKHLCDMLEFIKQYVLQPEQDTWSARDFNLTDYASEPLTVFYGIMEVKLISCLPKKGPFIIHIIGAEFKENFSLNFRAWELLMHLLKVSLIIILIGPKLDKKFEKFICRNLCKLCVKKSNTLQFDFYPLLYHKYVNETSSYKSPDLIVGFDVKLDESWTECIRTIKWAQNCPLFFTIKSRSEALENIENINKILGNIVTPFYHTVNKFCGYVPHRDPDTEYVYYINKRLIIYKNLRGKSTV